jgi:TatA/E family protein of Tat protein translocase
MFGLGPTELVVILVLALVLLGPNKLPDAASGLGKAIRSFRKATRDLTDQLDIDDEVKNPFRELKAAINNEPAPYVPPAAVVSAPIAPPAGVVASAPIPSMTEAPALPGPAANVELPAHDDAPKPDPKV